jgi:hypothetical protein
MSTILTIWEMTTWSVDIISSGRQTRFPIFCIWQFSTVGFCYLHVVLNIPTKISDSSWTEIWSKKLEEVNITPPPWLEG